MLFDFIFSEKENAVLESVILKLLTKYKIFSIFKNNFTTNKVNYAYDLNEIIEYYNLYHDLMSHWNTLLPNFIYNIKYEFIVWV